MALKTAKNRKAAAKVKITPRKVAAQRKKPILPKGARRPKVSAVRAGLTRVGRLFQSQIKKAKGEKRKELTAAYSLWKRRAYIIRKNLTSGNKAAVYSADMLIRMGDILAKSGEQIKHTKELISEVNRNVAGHSSNKGFVTRQLRRYVTSLSEARQSIISFLKSPKPRSLEAARSKIYAYQENSPKFKRALKFYDEALYFQAKHIVVLAKAKVLIKKINQRIKITKDAMDKGLLPRDEGNKIIKQLRILKKNVADVRVKNYKIRLKKYLIRDIVREKNGKIVRNHLFWDDLLQSEKRYERISGVVEAVSWQSMLAQEVNKYYAKGYWQMPAGTPARERSRKIIRMYIRAGKALLKRKNIPTFVEKNKGGARYNFSSGLVSRLRSLKQGVLAELNKLEAIIFKGKVGDAKRVMIGMSADNLKADEIIAKTVYDKMEEHFDNRSWWNKYKHVVADVAVIGLGILGTVVSAGAASPFIAAAEAAYFAGRFASDMVGNYMISGRLPGVFEVLGAAAMVIIPAGRFLKGAAGARRMRALGEKFGFSLRATEHLITTRLAGEVALKQAGKFAYVDTISNLAGKYLLGSAAISMMLDRSIENLATNAVFLAMGAGHGLTARMKARAIKRYEVGIKATLAAMSKLPPPIPLGAYIPARIRGIPRRLKEAIARARARGRKYIIVTTIKGEVRRVPLSELGGIEVALSKTGVSKRGGRASTILYESITKNLKTLKALYGERLEQEIRAALEGIELPKGKVERARYLEAVTKIAERLLGNQDKTIARLKELNAPEMVIEDGYRITKKQIQILRRALELCERSSKKVEYAELLVNVNISEITEVMQLFKRDRQVQFKDIPKEKQEARDRILKVLDAAKKGSEKEIKELIEVLRKHYSVDLLTENPYDIAIALIGNQKKIRKLLREIEGKNAAEVEANSFALEGEIGNAKTLAFALLKKLGIFVNPEGELFPFNRSGSIGGLSVYIISEKGILHEKGIEGVAYGMDSILVEAESTTQHELQHNFDNTVMSRKKLTEEHFGNKVEKEYRAYLASLAFSPEKDVRKVLKEIMRDYKKLKKDKKALEFYERNKDLESSIYTMLRLIDVEAEIGTKHEIAKTLIGGELKKAGARTAAQIKEAAKRLLNEAYKKETGLTYDEIIEPFK
jgi:hypothetical protein